MDNYLKKMAELERTHPVKKGSLNFVNWRHDDWCDKLNGRGECNCDPDAEVQTDLTLEQFALLMIGTKAPSQ